MTDRKLYKVLNADGRSTHGGSLDWSLPDGDKPGDWHEVDGALVLCEHGLHLTWDPVKWFAAGYRVFECETDGEHGESAESDAKTVVRRCRLARELSDADLVELRILKYGEHEICDDTVWAYDSATVTAYDSATVTASDSATVTASDSATVRASDSATVRAYGSATVRAFQKTTIVAHGGSATVALHDRATFVDQRGHEPVVRVARKPGDEARGS
jgi:hypothetical protein